MRALLFLRRHWLAVIGALPAVTVVWKGIVWLLDWIGRLEVIKAHSEEARAMFDVLTNPPWNVVLMFAGLLLIWWDVKGRSQFFPQHTEIEPAVSVPPPPAADQASTPTVVGLTADALSLAAPIVEVNIDTGRLQRSAPWLFFGFVAFNGSDGPIRLVSASGRLSVHGIDMHDPVEFENAPAEEIERFRLFRFWLKVPVRDRNVAEQIENLASINVDFHDVQIAAMSASAVNFRLWLLRHVHFKNDGSGRDPSYIHTFISKRQG